MYQFVVVHYSVVVAGIPPTLPSLLGPLPQSIPVNPRHTSALRPFAPAVSCAGMFCIALAVFLNCFQSLLKSHLSMRPSLTTLFLTQFTNNFFHKPPSLYICSISVELYAHSRRVGRTLHLSCLKQCPSHDTE